MVSGGSDSTAMLEVFDAYVKTGRADDELTRMLAESFPEPEGLELHVLHVNHMLRGEASDGDERFVQELCEKLGIPCEVVAVDIHELSSNKKGGMEAVAREKRYELAQEALDEACALSGAQNGCTCTAHTLDDRIETFFMRALVGTGPGGLASIPKRRGDLVRPFLDATREQLRDWLRSKHPGMDDDALWREDETNYTGDNFRSRVRRELIPVVRDLRPGYEGSLKQTMDLIEDENEAIDQMADSIVYRNLQWDGEAAMLATSAVEGLERFIARRVIRKCLLVVDPDARLEAPQIERVLDNMGCEGFTTETSGALRVRVEDGMLSIRKAQ